MYKLIVLPDEYDAAQDRGEVAKNGDNLPSVPKQNSKPTAKDIGLSRNEQVSRWIELMSAKKAQEVLRQADAKPMGGRPESGVRAAARQLNISEPDARRAVKVAALAPEAKQAARDAGLKDIHEARIIRDAERPTSRVG